MGGLIVTVSAKIEVRFLVEALVGFPQQHLMLPCPMEGLIVQCICGNRGSIPRGGVKAAFVLRERSHTVLTMIDGDRGANPWLRLGRQRAIRLI